MVFHGNVSRVGGELPWWRVSAPPPLGPTLVAYAFMLCPATAGFIWEWSWLFTLGLIAPGFIVHQVLGYRAARVRGIHLREELLSGRFMIIFGGVSALAGALLSTGGPRYAVPLIIVIGLAIFVEPVWRMAWRLHDRRSREQ